MSELSLDDLLRVVRGIARGEPPPSSHARRPLPWIAWLALGLVRYRARQRLAYQELGDRKLPRAGGVVEGTAWSCRPVANLSCMEVTNGDIHVVFRVAETDDRDHVAMDPEMLIAFSFAGATFVERDSSMVSFQLQSCLNPSTPSRAELPLGGLAAWLTKRIGGRIVADPWWLQLPPALETLAAQIDPRFDEWRNKEGTAFIAGWIGDSISTEADPMHRARLRRRHLRLIRREVDRGEIMIVHALPALIFQDDLTSTIDAMLKRNRDDLILCGQLIDVLERAWSPLSRYLVERIEAPHDLKADELDLLQIAVPYMLRRGMEWKRVREFLRRLVQPDRSLPRLANRRLFPALGGDILVNEPALGRAWIRRVLADENVATVRVAAALLVAIGAPWCIAELRAVAARAAHRNELLAALAHLGVVEWNAEGSEPCRGLFSSPAAFVSHQTGDGRLIVEIQSWRERIDALSPSLRGLLERG